jgi:uncharacterized protein (TIGR02599 family)
MPGRANAAESGKWARPANARTPLRMRRATAPAAVHSPPARAFTVLELLVTMAVLSVFVLLLALVTDNSFKLWRRTASDISMFDSARAAFDAMTRRLSQATVNTYLDYYDSGWNRRSAANAASFTPAKYGRASDLAIYSGFPDGLGLPGGAKQGHGIYFFAPLGYTGSNASLTDLPNLLNPVGYHVEWGDDTGLRPSFLSPLPSKSRFRLVETILPSQDFTLYPGFTNPATPMDNGDWINPSLGLSSAHRVALADNIIALIIRPEVTEKEAGLLGFADPWDLTADYIYDSRAGEQRTTSPEDIQFAQLPPLLRVVMVAVSEKDAARLVSGTTIPAALKLDTNWFTKPADLQQDLDALAKQLNDAGIQFRIFNQVIPLRGAKFSAAKEK